MKCRLLFVYLQTNMLQKLIFCHPVYHLGFFINTKLIRNIHILYLQIQSNGTHRISDSLHYSKHNSRRWFNQICRYYNSWGASHLPCHGSMNIKHVFKPQNGMRATLWISEILEYCGNLYIRILITLKHKMVCWLLFGHLLCKNVAKNETK